jgi:hypothetical protein
LIGRLSQLQYAEKDIAEIFKAKPKIVEIKCNVPLTFAQVLAQPEWMKILDDIIKSFSVESMQINYDSITVRCEE